MYVQYAENVKKQKRGAIIVTSDKHNVCYFKGVKLILEEYGLWFDHDAHHLGKKQRIDCTANVKDDNKGCARHLLASQPDFCEQKTALCEVVENAGHILNFILNITVNATRLKDIREQQNKQLELTVKKFAQFLRFCIAC